MAENNTKLWYAIDVTVDPAACEAIESALNELDALGTEIDSLRKAKGEPQRVSGYFETLPPQDAIDDAIGEALRIYDLGPESVVSLDTHPVEQTDWLAEWKKHWKPTVIDNFVIAPPWETVDDPSKIVISIEPNMAFGTGTHETTQLCLRVIGSELRPDETVLDVGAGTGILSIAAAKIGTGRILACDTDKDSVKIAKENADLNSVGGRIENFEGSIGDDTPAFDFVCANLTIDVILPLLDVLLAKSMRILLLSGILGIQRPMIVEALEKAGQHDYSIAEAGEWISVTVRVGRAF